MESVAVVQCEVESGPKNLFSGPGVAFHSLHGTRSTPVVHAIANVDALRFRLSHGYFPFSFLLESWPRPFESGKIYREDQQDGQIGKNILLQRSTSQDHCHEVSIIMSKTS